MKLTPQQINEKIAELREPRPRSAGSTIRGRLEMSEKTYTMVYDTDLYRPACVLLQAAYRADQGALNEFFESQDWLVQPTPGMKKLSGTAEQWKRAAQMTKDRREQK